MRPLYLTIFCMLFSHVGFCQNDFPESKTDSLKILNFEAQKAWQMSNITGNQLIAESNRQKINFLKYNEERYRWHGTTSTIIFFVVISIVLSGLLFSGIQFYKSLGMSQSKITEAISESQTIKISLKGIEIASSVLGVIILVISIAFFYLYLSEVYPLNIDGAEKADPKVKTSITK